MTANQTVSFYPGANGAGAVVGGENNSREKMMQILLEMQKEQNNPQQNQNSGSGPNLNQLMDMKNAMSGSGGTGGGMQLGGGLGSPAYSLGGAGSGAGAAGGGAGYSLGGAGYATTGSGMQLGGGLGSSAYSLGGAGGGALGGGGAAAGGGGGAAAGGAAGGGAFASAGSAGPVGLMILATALAQKYGDRQGNSTQGKFIEGSLPSVIGPISEGRPLAMIPGIGPWLAKDRKSGSKSDGGRLFGLFGG
jgi:hypothetical protein